MAAKTVVMPKKTYGNNIMCQDVVNRRCKMFRESKRDAADADRAVHPSTSHSDQNVRNRSNILKSVRRLRERMLADDSQFYLKVLIILQRREKHARKNNSNTLSLSRTVFIVTEYLAKLCVARLH